MGDIFDEVAELENADLDAKDTATPESEDANFNAAELEDIMAEIDNLEKDLAPEVAPVAEVKPVAKIVETPKPAPAPVATKKVEPEVLVFEKKQMPTPTSTSTSTNNVSLQAAGNMTLNLAFKIGADEATLIIDQEKGLLVSFSGVELSLHAENGCKVEMANGVSFTVPVQNADGTTKKKAA